MSEQDVYILPAFANGGTQKCNKKYVWNGGGAKDPKKRATHVQISPIAVIQIVYNEVQQ